MGSSTVHFLPGAQIDPQAPTAPSGLNLGEQELIAASGGYTRPADQLRALHARGFVRAWRRANGKGPVILERAHYDAVVRGQFGSQPAANESGERKPMAPNRAGYRQKFGAKRGA